MKKKTMNRRNVKHTDTHTRYTLQHRDIWPANFVVTIPCNLDRFNHKTIHTNSYHEPFCRPGPLSPPPPSAYESHHMADLRQKYREARELKCSPNLWANWVIRVERNAVCCNVEIIWYITHMVCIRRRQPQMKEKYNIISIDDVSRHWMGFCYARLTSPIWRERICSQSNKAIDSCCPATILITLLQFWESTYTALTSSHFMCFLVYNMFNALLCSCNCYSWLLCVFSLISLSLLLLLQCPPLF